MKTLTVATRRGELALAQTRSVIAALQAQHPGLEVRIQEITTAGDHDRRTALWDLKDTGFFTSQLEDALLNGAADFAVHSFKDLPTREAEGLAVTAIGNRQWPEDGLLARQPIASLDQLPQGARVGTSSLRRAAQLRHLRPDLELVPLRGNVQTRIRKLQTADLDAIILARAGLERLGLAGMISLVFDPKQFLPAPAQGTLAIQTRRDDRETVAIVHSLDDEATRALVLAERQVLVAMQCGCHAPVGAYAESTRDGIEIHAFISDIEGRQLIKRRARGPVAQALELGERVARELLDAGGREILRDLERSRDSSGAERSSEVGDAPQSASSRQTAQPLDDPARGQNRPRTGVAYLVGAGPGRADLITLRGAELLRTADCIIIDKLANPALLELARPDAEIVHVPKRIGPGSFTQDQINRILVEKALAGKTVVRLKGGDPCIFGRCTEEAALLNAAGVDFEIVPGITAAIAAAEYTGIMLTDRRYSSQVAFITGREAEGKEDSNIDWSVLARFPGTLVFYMGIGTLPTISTELMARGLSGDTPTALVANATLPGQRVVRAPLREIVETCGREQIEPPALIIVGPAAQGEAGLNWFMRKPLFGRTIVVTRDAAGNAEMARKIILRAGRPLEFTTLALQPLTDRNEFLRVLTELGGYDWVIFTSPNGVDFFFEALGTLGKDARVFGSLRLATLGAKTAECLAQYGLKADFVPTVFTGRDLGLQLLSSANLHEKKVLLLRSELASDELVEVLQQGGAHVRDVSIYTAVSQKGDAAGLAEQMRQGQVHWLTFASPSAVRGFFEQVPPGIVNDSQTKVASIGPVTSRELTQLGVRIDVEAPEHTVDGMLDALEDAERC
ncbi:MAG: hydroxymethylbilane synthase [Planctomycetes bacterium]|nr:hydroxymethylbilane synthase [Planctomycetota bacterium]